MRVYYPGHGHFSLFGFPFESKAVFGLYTHHLSQYSYASILKMSLRKRKCNLNNYPTSRVTVKVSVLGIAIASQLDQTFNKLPEE